MLKQDQRFEFALESQHQAFDRFVEINPDLEEVATYMFECPDDKSFLMKEATAKVLDRMQEGQSEAMEFWIAFGRVVIHKAFKEGKFHAYKQRD